MAAPQMPLLLDGTMDVEEALDVMGGAMALDDVDLFGDPVMDTVMNTVMDADLGPVVSNALRQRLDALRGRGCCSGIAWSRQGTIAIITPDGQAIELRFLRTDPENGSWDMSEPSPSPVSWPVLAGGPLVHLAWAANGSPELAVFDAVGRISILSFSITLNRPYQTRRWDADTLNDLHAVVGCYWLPLLPAARQFNIIYGPAVWTGNEYRYESSPVPAFGPYHPNPAKSALLCVTANGQLKLLFSQNNNKLEEVSVELESVTSSGDIITHASICSDKGHLTIALATASKKLKVVQVGINWGSPSDKQAPPGGIPLNPTLKPRHVATTTFVQHGPSESLLDGAMAQLSHIEVLPQTVDPSAPTTLTSSFILTVRSYVPQDSSPFGQQVQSIVDRWEILLEHRRSLHVAFGQLGLKSSSAETPADAPTTLLKKLEPVVIAKIIVSIHLMQLGRVICFAFSDGTVQFRDRFTMKEIYLEPNLTKIKSPQHAGFHFVDPTPCVQVAFSPTNCSFVQTNEDGLVKWNLLRYPMEQLDAAIPGHSPYAAVTAALSLAATLGAGSSSNYDDILAVCRPFTERPEFVYDWIRDLVNMLKIQVDYSEESHHEFLVRNNSLHLCLSILNHVGFRGEYHARTFGGKFAMLALNARNMVVLITLASNTPINLREKLSPFDEPEVVDTLAGCAKWGMDLLTWLSDSMFCLLNDAKFMQILSEPRQFQELSTYLKSQNDVALYLMLCSSTRGYLSACCRRLLHLESLSTKAIHYYHGRSQAQENAEATRSRATPALFVAYRKLQRNTNSSMVKVTEFDKLLSQLGTDIRAAYQGSLGPLKTAGNNANAQQQNGATNSSANNDPVKKAQALIELDMLLASNPPMQFREVLHKFFEVSVRNFRSTTDPAKLFFVDYSLLEVVDDDVRSLARRRALGARVDVFKRMPLTSTAGSAAVGYVCPGHGFRPVPQWRRCARCAAVMEEATAIGHRPGFTFVLGQQRKCSCGGNWGLLPAGMLVN